jgi:hypothetical protein
MFCILYTTYMVICTTKEYYSGYGSKLLVTNSGGRKEGFWGFKQWRSQGGGGAKGAIAPPMGRVYMYNVSRLFNRINGCSF